MSSVQPISLSFFLLMAAAWALAVINVWLFVESHPECWHQETPRSQRGTCRVAPHLLMHTSRWNSIAQVLMWLADCTPRGGPSSSSTVSKTATEELCFYLPWTRSGLTLIWWKGESWRNTNPLVCNGLSGGWGMMISQLSGQFLKRNLRVILMKNNKSHPHKATTVWAKKFTLMHPVLLNQICNHVSVI